MKQAYSRNGMMCFSLHTRADREQAEQLAEQLRAAGLSVYLDVDDEALSRLHGRELAERLKNIPQPQPFIAVCVFGALDRIALDAMGAGPGARRGGLITLLCR